MLHETIAGIKSVTRLGAEHATELRSWNLDWTRIVVVAATVLAHSLAIVAIDWTTPVGAVTFACEARWLTVLTVLPAVAGIVVTRAIHFRLAMVFRLVLLGVAFRIYGPHAYAGRLILVNLVIIDAGIYEEARPATVALSIIATLVLWNEIASGWPLAGASERLRVVGMLVSMAITGTGSIGLTRLRERSVRDERTIRDLNAALDRLSITNLGLQSYAANAQAESAAAERLRITRELHDSVGYAMTNICMTMNASKLLAQRFDDTTLVGLLETTRTTAQGCLEETRSTLYRLRSIIERQSPGLNALAHLARVYSEATGVDVRVDYQNARKSYGPVIDETAYRLVQEGLTNVFRHNRAELIRTRIILYEHGSNLEISIWDSGGGTGVVKEGIGLRGMRERVTELGGTIRFDLSPHGFEVCAMIPVGVSRDAAPNSRPDR